MKHKLTLILVIGSVALAGVGVGAAASGSVNATSNGTLSANASASTGGDLVHQGVNADLGTVTLKRWEFEPQGGALTIYFSAEHATRIKISDAGKANQEQTGADGPGGARIPGRGFNLPSGSSSITIHPHVYGDGRMAVSVGTTGDGYRLWTDGLTAAKPAIQYSAARNLIFLVGIGAVGVTLGLVRRRVDDETKDVRRDY